MKNKDMAKESIFNFWLSVDNCGDGSVAILVSKNENEAKNKDESQDEGWAESTVRKFPLKIIDNKIYRFNQYWNQEKLQLIQEWVELEQE